MAETTTTNYGLAKPEVGASAGAQQQGLTQAQLDAAYEAWMLGLQEQHQRQQEAAQAVGIMGNPVLNDSRGVSNSRSSGINFGL